MLVLAAISKGYRLLHVVWLVVCARGPLGLLLATLLVQLVFVVDLPVLVFLVFVSSSLCSLSTCCDGLVRSAVASDWNALTWIALGQPRGSCGAHGSDSFHCRHTKSAQLFVLALVVALALLGPTAGVCLLG